MTYYVVLLVCLHFGAPPYPCLRVQDDQGPYEIEALCEARFKAMVSMIDQMLAYPLTFHGGCGASKNERLG